MAALTVLRSVSTQGKEIIMLALAYSHMTVHRQSSRELFRAAYQWRFRKDITELALANDAKQFMESGNAPDYLVRYLIHCYGVH